MKKIVFLSVLIISFFFSSCLKPKHSIRVRNEYAVALRVTIGPNDYGTVGAGSTSAYKSIPEGNHTISGDVQGSVSLTGKGKHNWTLTITSGGSVSIKEDK